MHSDVTELLDFYARPLGSVVRRILMRRIRARWTNVKGATVVGLGFATPYLAAFRGEAHRVLALMPIAQGAVVWPPGGTVMTAVVEEYQLPLPDNSVDNMLAIHCLEASEQVRGLLREMWRVLKPEGRLLLVVPNRRGVWARLDTTPFGHGRPYSQGQLDRLLTDALFSPLDRGMALMLPPLDRRMILRSAVTLERIGIGMRLASAIAGVIVVEVKKELVAPMPPGTVAKIVKELVPVRGAARASHDTREHDVALADQADVPAHVDGRTPRAIRS